LGCFTSALTEALALSLAQARYSLCSSLIRGLCWRTLYANANWPCICNTCTGKIQHYINGVLGSVFCRFDSCSVWLASLKVFDPYEFMTAMLVQMLVPATLVLTFMMADSRFDPTSLSLCKANNQSCKATCRAMTS
jgi:hypothetical protein